MPKKTKPTPSTARLHPVAQVVLIIVTFITLGFIFLLVLGYLINEKNYFGGDPDKTNQLSQLESSSFPVASYQDFVVSYSDEYPHLLTKNHQQYIADVAGFVPTVIKEDSDSVTVYADMAQTVLTIPKGWFGADTASSESIFFLPNKKTLIELSFENFGEPISSMSELQEKLNQDLADQQRSIEKEQAGKLDYKTTKLNNEQLLVEATISDESRWFVYTLNHVKPQFVHSVKLIGEEGTEAYFGLLGLIIKDMKVIGIHPDESEFARDEYVQALKNFDSSYGMKDSGVNYTEVNSPEELKSVVQ